MRIVLLALLVYSTTAFTANCGSHGHGVSTWLRSLFIGDEEAPNREATLISDVSLFSTYPEDAKVPAPENTAVHDSVPPKFYRQPALDTPSARTSGPPPMLKSKRNLDRRYQLLVDTYLKLLEALIDENNLGENSW